MYKKKKHQRFTWQFAVKVFIPLLVAAGVLLHVGSGRKISATQVTSRWPSNGIDEVDSLHGINKGAARSQSCLPLTSADEEQLLLLQRTGSCKRLANVCWDQGNLIIDAGRGNESFNKPPSWHLRGAFHPYLFPRSMSREENVLQGFPYHVQTLEDISVRIRSAMEPTSETNDPEYSKCTIPIILYPIFAFNFGHTFQRLGPWLYNITQSFHGSLLNAKLKPVIKTPHGLRLPTFTPSLVQPLFQQRLQTLADASNRGQDESCFENLLVCTSNPVVNVWQYGQFIRSVYDGSASVASAEKRVRRVTFQVRLNDSRQLQGVENLVKQCNSAVIDGIKLVCRTDAFEDVTVSASTLAETDILIGTHGAGLVNAFMLPAGASVIEILPLDLVRFPYAERNQADSNSKLFWWHLYVCDHTKAAPGQQEKQQHPFRFSWPLYRGSTVAWGSLEQVIQSTLLVDKRKSKYIKLYNANKHSFFILPDGTRQSTATDPTDRCPNFGTFPTTPKVATKYPKMGVIEEMFTVWEVPPYPRGIALLLNGCNRNATQFWEPSKACPACEGYLEHVKLKNVALNKQLAVVAISADKFGPKYDTWEPDYSDGFVRMVRKMRSCFDDRKDAAKSVDAPRIAEIVRQIRQVESLDGLPLFVVGYSSGARIGLMLPTILPIRGIYAVAMHADPWLEGWMQASKSPYPPVALVGMSRIPTPIMQDGYKKTAAMLEEAGVPVAFLDIKMVNVETEYVQRWFNLDAALSNELIRELRQAKWITASGASAVYGLDVIFGIKLCSMFQTTIFAAVEDVAACDLRGQEFLFWLAAAHYAYADGADQIMSWLIDGGTDAPPHWTKDWREFPWS